MENFQKSIKLGRDIKCAFDMMHKYFDRIECDFPHAKRKRWYMIDCYLISRIVTLLIRAKNSKEACKMAWKQIAYYNVFAMHIEVSHIPKNYIRKVHTHRRRKEYFALDRGNLFMNRNKENWMDKNIHNVNS